MPCENTLAPAIGCRGPGSDSACDYCKDRPVKKPAPKPRAPLSPQAATTLIAHGATTPPPVRVWQPAVVPCKKRPQPPPYVLTALDVSRACGSPGSWWQVVDANRTVEVKATTKPNAPAAWGRLDWATNVKQVSRSGVGTQTITCRMGGDPAKSVTIDIYDLTSLSASEGQQTGSTLKVYEAAGRDVTITAVTNPDTAKVWPHIQWSAAITAGAGAPGLGAPSGQQTKVALSPARDVKVTATLGCSPALGQKTLETTVHVCKWPNLEVQEVRFSDSSIVYNDGAKEIDKPFDKKWIKGRPDPATNCVTASTQSPLCYAGNSAVKVSAIFNVIEKPTEDEDVWVSGVATCDGKQLEWRQKIKVRAADSQASLSDVTSQPLPAGVALRKDFKIEWYMTESDKKTWRKIGTTSHLLYQTLGAPSVKAYWTLLDISCGGGAGKTTENDFVPASFVPFTKHTGDNNGMPRMGDGLKMSYYKTGVKTAADDTTYTTKGILSGPEATGRCGGWADLLTYMWKMHGITSSVRRWYVRSLSKDITDMKQRFLVKNCDFSGKANLKGGLYTHKGAAALKKDGAFGQGKNNPQFDFGDHVVCKHNGQLYDPSYGLGPFADDKTYLSKALDGLGSQVKGQVDFTMADGTKQHIPAECVPYSKGFADYRLGPQTLQDIADEYGVTAQVLLDADPVLKTKRGTVDKVQPGDTVVVPTRPMPTPHKLSPDVITMDLIASKYGVSKQAIFDHSRNKALKKQRGTPAGVKDGDHVIVSFELIKSGGWVTGHDL